MAAITNGGVVLQPGQKYVMGFTMSDPDDYAASGGQLAFQLAPMNHFLLPLGFDFGGGSAVWMDNTNNFAALNSRPWDTSGYIGAMAFTAHFDVVPTPLPSPIISCPAATTIECTGRPTTVTVNVTDTNGVPVEVVWTVDGSIYQTNIIPVRGVIGSTNPPGMVTLTKSFELGTHTIDVSASNGRSEPAVCSTSVTVQDTLPPVFGTIPTNMTVECSHFPIRGIPMLATDQCDGYFLPVQFSSTTVPGSCPGSASLVETWTATDAAGNSTSVSRTVTVQDTQPPVLTNVPADVTVECDAVPPVGFVGATDQCDRNPTVTFSETSTQTASGKSHANYKVVRTWTATDACGNASTGQQTITVTDTTAPTIVSASASPKMLWPPNGFLVPVQFHVQAVDACGRTKCRIVGIRCKDTGWGNDWRITGDMTAELRAIPSGRLADRVYVVTIACSDESGNTSMTSVQVTVPHDRAGR